MSVDYAAVGGIGINVSEEIVTKLINNGVFSAEEWAEDEDYCIDRLRIPYGLIGNAYTGETGFVLLVEAEKYSELREAVPVFLERVNRLGIGVTENDLEVISDLYVY